MKTIDGFSIEPCASDTFMFGRLAEPHHRYEYRITSKHIDLVQRVPAAASHGDPDVDAQRYQGDAAKAADKYRKLLFPEAGSAEAAE